MPIMQSPPTYPHLLSADCYDNLVDILCAAVTEPVARQRIIKLLAELGGIHPLSPGPTEAADDHQRPCEALTETERLIWHLLEDLEGTGDPKRR